MDEKLQERLSRLYENASIHFSLPDYETFVEDMKDYDKLSRLRDNMLEHYTMPSMEQVALDFGVKKKESSEVISQKEITGSPTEVQQEPLFLGGSEKEFVEKNEEDAIVDLQKELTTKGFSVTETGMGDALNIVDNITGEEIDIDLQPIFNKDEEVSKVKSLLEKPSDSKRALLSANQLMDVAKDRFKYFQDLNNKYPGLTFEYDASRDMAVMNNGESVEEFNLGGSQIKDILTKTSSFIYKNLTDEQADILTEERNYKLFNKINSDIDNIDIDISDESVNNDFYGKDYFKGLFNYLEEAGIVISKEAKQELAKGTKLVVTNMGLRQRVGAKPFTKADIDNGLQKYFASNPEAQKVIREYDVFGLSEVKKNKLDRAKKLAIENYYESLPNREYVKEVVRQVQKDISDKEAEIRTTLKMAQIDFKDVISGAKTEIQNLAKDNSGVSFQVIFDENDEFKDIISSEPVKELKQVKDKVKNTIDKYKTLINKSQYELDKINSKASTSEQFMDAANRNYGVIDLTINDFNNTAKQMLGGLGVIGGLALGATNSGAAGNQLIQSSRNLMKESNENTENFFKTKRTYKEAWSEGSIGEFIARTLGEQGPNIALAIGTAGAGHALNISKGIVSTLIATEFGLTSAGQKYDQLKTRQEIGNAASKALEELKKIKGVLSDEEYAKERYELERAIEDGNLTSKEITTAVIGTGIVEGVVTRFLGTTPNSVKLLKNLRKPAKFMDDILKSNYKATANALKGIGKSTLGEVAEETLIETLTQFNDYAFLGDQVDFSSLDDVAITSIITSGGMNVPSTAYSTILTQVNVNRYKSKIQGFTSDIASLKDMLSNPDLTDIQRSQIHNSITNTVKGIAEETNNMESDALLMGSDNIKEMLTLSGVRASMLNKAGVEVDDSYDIANVKVKEHLSKLDKDDAKKFTEQLEYVDNKRKTILESINYDGAIEKVFGEKGVEIEKTLDTKLTPQQKYVEVYKQIKGEINENAVKEFIETTKEEVVETTKEVKYVTELKETKESNPDVYWSVSEVTPEEASKSTLIDTEDGSAIVKPDGDISGLFKKAKSKTKGVAQVLLKKAVEAGGVKLDNFDGGLTKIYKKAGFRVIARTPFNEQYVDPGWVKEKHGTPDVVAMVYDPQNKLTIEEKMFDNPETGYDEMISYRDGVLESSGIQEEAKVQKEVQQLREMFASPDIKSQVENAKKSLSSLAPDVNVIIHESEQAYAEATGETGRKQKTAGTYDETVVDGKVNKTIHINPKKANARTVAHETFHAILLNMVNTNAEAQRVTEAMIKAVAKVASLELKNYLDDFASNYKQNIRAEEKLAELVGKLASEYDSLPKPTKNIIKRWLDRLAKMFGLKPFTDNEVIDVLNTISRKVAEGEIITEEDVNILDNEQGEGGSIGTFDFSNRNSIKAPSIENDTREFSNLVEQVDFREFKGEKFATNMYDYTTAGIVDFGNGLIIELFGGKNYVPYMMNKKGLGIGDVSNLAAFNTKEQVETFIRNVKEGNASLFAPHSGTLNGSWQFQQKIFEEIMGLIIDNNLISNKSLINTFNQGLINDKGNYIKSFETFRKRVGDVKDFSDFTPSEIVDFMSIEKNFSPDLRKRIANQLISNPDFKKALGLNSKNDFYQKIMDPMNKGVTGGELMGAVRFDPNTFKIVKTKRGDIDHHESFGYTLLAKIDGIYQPTDFYKTYDVTESYTKYNKKETIVSTRENSVDRKDYEKALKAKRPFKGTFKEFQEQKFIDKNVSSSAGSIPKIASFDKRKQIQNTEGIILRAKNANVSDAAIRQFLVETGLTLVEADNAVKEYNERVRTEKQKEQGIRVYDNKIKKTLYKALKFVTSAKGFNPKDTQIARENRNGFISANIKRAENTISKLQKLDKKGVYSENIDKYLRGDDNVELPDNIRRIAFQMRTHIDALSKSLVDSGAVSDVSFDKLPKSKRDKITEQYGTEQEARDGYKSTQEIILSKIGSYLTRSYEVFSNKDWKKKVSVEVLEDAKEFFRKDLKNEAEKVAKEDNRPFEIVLEEKVNAAINNLLDREKAKVFLANANEASKSNNVLRQRTNIPVQLRALMGEYTSPLQNYAITVNDVASLTAQQNFLNSVKEKGEGVFLFKDNNIKGFNVKIASEGSKTMNPLDGMYTSPEIAEALKGGEIIGTNLGQVQPLIDGWLKAVGTVKYTKTILSPGTHAKNFLGNTFFMIANGYVDPRDFAKAGLLVSNDLSGANNEQLNEKLLEYIDAGIINQNATLRDIKSMLSDSSADSQDAFQNKMTERFNSPKRIDKKIGRFAENLYQAEDDFFKIVAYEANKDRYAKAYFKKPFNELDTKQKEEISGVVKEIVKNTLPNYDRLPEIRKVMRAVPLAGTFISFHIEAIRTAYNTVDLAYKEFKDPRTRSIGAKRLSGLVALVGLKAFVLASIGLGADDEELEESVRLMSPSWDASSNIAIESVKDGVVKYRNFSSSDPWGIIDKVIISYMRAEKPVDGFMSALTEIAGPFFQKDILFNSLFLGYEESSEAKSNEQNAEDVIKRLYKTFSPGALTSSERILLEDKKTFIDAMMGKAKLRNEGTLNEIIGQLTGLKSRSIDIPTTLFYKFSEINSLGIGKKNPGLARIAISDYNSEFYKFNKGEITQEELDKSYEIANKNYKKQIKVSLDYYKAALKLNIPVSTIHEKMDKGGFSKAEIISLSMGVVPELKKKGSKPKMSEYEKLLKRMAK